LIALGKVVKSRLGEEWGLQSGAVSDAANGTPCAGPVPHNMGTPSLGVPPQRRTTNAKDPGLDVDSTPRHSHDACRSGDRCVACEPRRSIESRIESRLALSR